MPTDQLEDEQNVRSAARRTVLTFTLTFLCLHSTILKPNLNRSIDVRRWAMAKAYLPSLEFHSVVTRQQFRCVEHELNIDWSEILFLIPEETKTIDRSIASSVFVPSIVYWWNSFDRHWRCYSSSVRSLANCRVTMKHDCNCNQSVFLQTEKQNTCEEISVLAMQLKKNYDNITEEIRWSIRHGRATRSII